MELAVLLLLLLLFLLLILVFNKELNIDAVNRFEERFQHVIDTTLANVKFNMLLFRDILYDYMEAKHNVTELPQMSNRTALVTGGTRGIGFEVVKMLLQCDMTVIVACRDLSRGEKAIASIRDSGVVTGTTKVMKLDNASLKSVENFVNDFKFHYEKLDILINNAGVFSVPYQETVDGFEEHWGVNYLAHFFLTVSLVPLLKNAKEADWTARIVNVSSCSYEMGFIRFQDVNNKEKFVTLENYAQSKLAMLMFTKKLSREFDKLNIPVVVNAVHPGIVNTDIFMHDNSYFRYVQFFTNVFIKNPLEGAISIVYAAVSPQIGNKSGLYFYNCLERPISYYADNQITQDDLFKLSLKQVKLQNPSWNSS